MFTRAGETEAWLEALSVSQVHCSSPDVSKRRAPASIFPRVSAHHRQGDGPKLLISLVLPLAAAIAITSAADASRPDEIAWNRHKLSPPAKV